LDPRAGKITMNSLFRIDELRALESRAQVGLPPGTLMQRAGRAAAEAIDAGLRSRGRIAGTTGGTPGHVLVLCGPGNNGGDGFACAEALRGLGHEVSCWAPLPTTGSAVDALSARAAWCAGGAATLQQLPEATAFDLVVDALLGIGARRPLAGPLLRALRWTGERRLPVVALDIPSGLDADTGAWLGQVPGIAAEHTHTFLADKPGLHTLDGGAASGSVHVHALGLEALREAFGAPGVLNGPAQFRDLTLPRPLNSHKGIFGSVAIIGGGTGMVGAALLSARAALRLGAGKVFVECLGAPDLAFDPMQPELMLRKVDNASADVIVVGCGMGSDAMSSARLMSVLGHEGPLVLDADGLNLVAADPALHAALVRRTAATVLTPHPAEAGRLLARPTQEVQQDRVASALLLARAFSALVVLKGAGTVIAAPSGRYAVNPTGGPALASAGTGDVLAGMIGALLAQRTGPSDAGILDAVHAAVWLHGRAADRFGADIGLAASEIAPLAAHELALLRRH
jgi:hydroxyethylthiazole kinase-like uncharacterized protein yjeF